MDKSEAVKKAVKIMKEDEPVKEEVNYITADEVKSLLQNLQIQLQNFQKEANEKQTMALKTQGAIEVATAQLQGLENDSKPAD